MARTRRWLWRAALGAGLAMSLMAASCSSGAEQAPGPAASPSPVAPTVVGRTAAPESATPTPSPAPSVRAPVALSLQFIGVPGDYRAAVSHRTILDLQLFGGRIYIAHGDSIANTGPVLPAFFDLAANALGRDAGFQFDEEAIEKFRVDGQTLVAPGRDGREGWELGSFYRLRGGTWTKLRTVPGAVHVWDVASRPGVLVASGSTETTAGRLWESRDEGRTWRQALEYHRGSENGISYDASSVVVTLNGSFYAITSRDGCYRGDGANWIRVDCFGGGNIMLSKSDSDGNTVVGVPYYTAYFGTKMMNLYFLDSQRSWVVTFDDLVVDAISREGRWVVLTSRSDGGGELYMASSLRCRCRDDFKLAATIEAPPAGEANPRGNGPTALEYAEGRFYVGFADGRLFRSAPVSGLFSD